MTCTSTINTDCKYFTKKWTSVSYPNHNDCWFENTEWRSVCSYWVLFFSFHESETRFRPDTYFNLKSGKVTATSAHATFLKRPDVPGICSGPRGGGKGSACCWFYLCFIDVSLLPLTQGGQANVPLMSPSKSLVPFLSGSQLTSYSCWGLWGFLMFSKGNLLDWSVLTGGLVHRGGRRRCIR